MLNIPIIMADTIIFNNNATFKKAKMENSKNNTGIINTMKIRIIGKLLISFLHSVSSSKKSTYIAIV